MVLLKKNLAYIKLGIISNLAYRFDFIMGFILFPVIIYAIEAAFWVGIFHASGQATIGGYHLADYLAYLLWFLTQFGSMNLRSERVIIEEVNSGAVNSILLRPTSYYEFQLGQFLGQKILKSILMIPVILTIAAWWDLPIHIDRLWPAMAMGYCYLIMLFTLNFCLASLSFFFENIFNINLTKNMVLWFLTGELIPLDLFPDHIRDILVRLPFAGGIYLPAGYLSGRVPLDQFLFGFVSIAAGTLVFGLVARIIWKQGLRHYTGTGA